MKCMGQEGLRKRRFGVEHRIGGELASIKLNGLRT